MTQYNSNLAKYSSCLHFWHSALYSKKLLIISLKSHPHINMRSSLFQDITQCTLVVCYWRFTTNYRSQLQASSCPRPLKMRPMSWPETLVANYQSCHINIPEEQDPFTWRQKPEITQVQIHRLKHIFKFQCDGWATDPAATTSIPDIILWALFHVHMRTNFAF
jgi:hypothetical protein